MTHTLNASVGCAEILDVISTNHGTSQCFFVQGNINGHKHSYQLDDHHTFITGKPMLVCGNTAAMVGEQGHSWLAKSFDVSSEHS